MLLSVVCAICDVATIYFSISITLFAGSITLKYTTAFTFTGTLSLVITSCGGTSMVTVLKSTLTILSTKGIIMIKPGPLVPLNLPNLNITPLSYSLKILKADSNIIKRISAPNTIPNSETIDILTSVRFVYFGCIKNIFTILLYYKVTKRFDTLYRKTGINRI